MKLITTITIAITVLTVMAFLESCNNEYPNVVVNLPTCTVIHLPSGSLIKCPDGTSTLITNGSNGSNGSNGTNGTNGVDGIDGQDGQNGQDAIINGLYIIEIINPCGNSPSVYDEVFLRLSDDTIVSSFSDSTSGTNTRFSVLEPGNYRTTDGDNCYFSVDSNNNITNEHH